MTRDFEIIKVREPHGVTLYPVADVHLGAIEHDRVAWHTFTKTIEEDPTARVILVGDLINNAVKSSVSNVYDEWLRPREQKQLMVEHLKPIRDKIIAATGGNHEARTAKESDQDITYDILAKLDLEDIYRENICFVKIEIGEKCPNKKSGMARSTYTVAATHGAGGGIYTGATVNRGERFSGYIDGLDLLITGHTHKGAVTRPSKLVFDTHNNTITTREMVVVSTESFLCWGGYAARKMLSPAEIGNPPRIVLEERPKKVSIRW